ncbi:hypothetical protein DSO57_1036460, partial [Entomophthora muscae]
WARLIGLSSGLIPCEPQELSEHELIRKSLQGSVAYIGTCGWYRVLDFTWAEHAEKRSFRGSMANLWAGIGL